MTAFSYSWRVKSPEWRRQRRRANLRHSEIFRHGPVTIYTRLPAGGTYYPICTFPASSECLIGISDAFSAFCLRVSVIFPMCSLYPPKKRAYSVLHPQAWTCIYRYHAQRLLPSAVPWISEDRLLSVTETTTATASYHCRLEGTVPVIRVSPYMALNSSKRLPSTTRAITCNATLSESNLLQTVSRRPVSATIIKVISTLRILQCSKCVTKSNIRNNIQN